MDVIAKTNIEKKSQVRLLRTVRCEHSKISSVCHRLLCCDVASGFWVFQCGAAPLASLTQPPLHRAEIHHFGSSVAEFWANAEDRRNKNRMKVGARTRRTKTFPAVQRRKDNDNGWNTTADDNDARKDVHGDRRSDPQTHLGAWQGMRQTISTGQGKNGHASQEDDVTGKKNAMQRPHCGRNGSEKNPPKSKKSQARLLGFVRCQHPKLLPAGIVAAFVPRRTAQRAGINPFRNANGRFLSQRGCVVNTYVTPTELCPYDFQKCSASVRKVNTNNRASTRDTQAGIQGGQVTMLVNIELAISRTFLFILRKSVSKLNKNSKMIWKLQWNLVFSYWFFSY